MVDRVGQCWRATDARVLVLRSVRHDWHPIVFHTALHLNADSCGRTFTLEERLEQPWEENTGMERLT